MKPCALLVAAAFLTAGLPAARASTAIANYWDAAHTTNVPGGGGTGMWDLTTANWVRFGGSDTTFLSYPAGAITYFEGAAGTVNLDTDGINSSSLYFYTPGYVLQDTPGSSHVLTINGGIEAQTTSGTVTVSLPMVLSGSTGGGLGVTAGGTLAVSGNFTASNTLLLGGNTTNGTVILSGNNSVTGTTTIDGGTVELAGTSSSGANGAHPMAPAAPAQVLNGTSNVLIEAGTLLYAASNQLSPGTPINLDGGTFNLGTFSQDRANTLGALTLSYNSAIDFGAGASTGGVLAFADSSQIAWSGKLSIYNFHGTPLVGGGLDQLFFGTSASGLTAAQVADITFYAGGPGSVELGTGIILSDGEVTYTPSVVPEPSTWAFLVGSVGVLVAVLRRRIAWQV